MYYAPDAPEFIGFRGTISLARNEKPARPAFSRHAGLPGQREGRQHRLGTGRRTDLHGHPDEMEPERPGFRASEGRSGLVDEATPKPQAAVGTDLDLVECRPT